MVKSGNHRLDARALWTRVLLWALMASAIAWTLAYKTGKSDSDVPEFVYVNF